MAPVSSPSRGFYRLASALSLLLPASMLLLWYYWVFLFIWSAFSSPFAHVTWIPWVSLIKFTLLRNGIRNKSIICLSVFSLSSLWGWVSCHGSVWADFEFQVKINNFVCFKRHSALAIPVQTIHVQFSGCVIVAVWLLVVLLYCSVITVYHCTNIDSNRCYKFVIKFTNLCCTPARNTFIFFLSLKKEKFNSIYAMETHYLPETLQAANHYLWYITSVDVDLHSTKI